MRTSFRQKALSTTLLIGLGALLAAAAPAPASDPAGARPPAAVSSQTQATPGARDALASKVEPRIKELHAKLQITAAQQPLWDQFAQVMRDNAADMDTTFQHRMQTRSHMTAVENVESYAQLAAAHAQNVAKLVPPLQALYATMTDSQKLLADQAFRDDAHHGAPARHR